MLKNGFKVYLLEQASKVIKLILLVLIQLCSDIVTEDTRIEYSHQNNVKMKMINIMEFKG